MQVILIGSGNVATVLGKILFANGHRILQVYSRNMAHATTLAKQLQAVPVIDTKQVSGDADLYIIAVADDALPQVARELSVGSKLVIHTAGSVSREILKNTSTSYGVLWPVKMIRRATTAISPATIVIDGNTEITVQEIKELAKGFSTAVARADDLTRMKMHMIATLTANFSNHLYHLAADYCTNEQIDLSYFYPLIEATVSQLYEQHPKENQAGPAFRGDTQTIEKHKELLVAYPQIEKVYEVLNESVRKSFNRVN